MNTKSTLFSEKSISFQGRPGFLFVPCVFLVNGSSFCFVLFFNEVNDIEHTRIGAFYSYCMLLSLVISILSFSEKSLLGVSVGTLTRVSGHLFKILKEDL